MLPYGGDDITEFLLYLLRREHSIGKGGIGVFHEVIHMSGLQLPQTFEAVNKCKETICKFLLNVLNINYPFLFILRFHLRQ